MANKELTNTEKALELTRTAIKGTKVVENEINTGISFFEGKKRLVKILKSKTGLSLEINVVLSKEIEEKFGLTKITRKQAHEKHLGTMQYMARVNDIKAFPELIKAAVEAFKAEQVLEKANKELEQAQ